MVVGIQNIRETNDREHMMGVDGSQSVTVSSDYELKIKSSPIMSGSMVSEIVKNKKTYFVDYSIKISDNGKGISKEGIQALFVNYAKL